MIHANMNQRTTEDFTSSLFNSNYETQHLANFLAIYVN